MEFSLLNRRKLPLLFLLGVGVPSLALSLLAFRGIQNELALLEQRQLDEHRALVDRISDTLAVRIDGTERAFTPILSGQTSPLSFPLSLPLIRSLDSLKSQLPLIEAAFLLDESGGIRLPTAELLFRADGAIQSSGPPSWTGSAAEHMRSAQQEEFQANRYGEALTSYQRAFDAVSDSVLKGEALLASTRVLRKAGRPGEALRACERLLRDFDAIRTSEGIPLGAIAFLEQGALLLTTGDSMAALRGGVE